VRRVRARKVRVDRRVRAVTGGQGISRVSGEAGRGESLRMATSMPPALTLSAVANSRNSRPLRSRLQTKTGMASGSRLHWRRSFWRLLAFMLTRPQASTGCQTAPKLPNLRPKCGETGGNDGAFGRNTGKTLEDRALAGFSFTFCSLGKGSSHRQTIVKKCNLLLHLGNSVVLFR